MQRLAWAALASVLLLVLALLEALFAHATRTDKALLLALASLTFAVLALRE